jgi:hypothetical protein
MGRGLRRGSLRRAQRDAFSDARAKLIESLAILLEKGRVLMNFGSLTVTCRMSAVILLANAERTSFYVGFAPNRRHFDPQPAPPSNRSHYPAAQDSRRHGANHQHKDDRNERCCRLPEFRASKRKFVMTITDILPPSPYILYGSAMDVAAADAMGKPCPEQERARPWRLSLEPSTTTF